MLKTKLTTISEYICILNHCVICQLLIILRFDHLVSWCTSKGTLAINIIQFSGIVIFILVEAIVSAISFTIRIFSVTVVPMPFSLFRSRTRTMFPFLFMFLVFIFLFMFLGRSHCVGYGFKSLLLIIVVVFCAKHKSEGCW